MKEGEKYKVKSTPILRQYGIHCRSYEPNDCKVWPGEVGEVEVYEGNGWKGMRLVFSRDRQVQIGTLFSDGDWEIDPDKMKEFKKVKA